MNTPGLKYRKRKQAPDRRIWLPRPQDVKAGFRPKSIPIPDSATDAEAAALCQQYQVELIRWRKTGSTNVQKKKGTWARLVDEYQKSEISPYASLSERTRADYDGYMRSIRTAIGDRMVAGTNADDLWRWYKKWARCPRELTLEEAEAAGNRLRYVRAKHHMGMVRRLARMAVLLGIKDCDHIEGLFAALKGRMRGPRARTQYPTWEQILALVAAADKIGRSSVGTATLFQFELGQRQGDVIGRWHKRTSHASGGIEDRGQTWSDGLTWNDIDKNWFLTIGQNKSNGDVVLTFDLHDFPELLNRLVGIPKSKRVGPLIISETTGRPYRGSNFSTVFRKVANAADWQADLWNMDSKAGAATEATDAGATSKDVQSLTGHKTEVMASRYARTTDSKRSKVTKLRREMRRGRKGNDEGER